MATQRDYFDSLYATDSGRSMLAELWFVTSTMPVETADDAVRKLSRYDMLFAMREAAGIRMGPDLILAESSVASQDEEEEGTVDLMEP